ncbi:hypothetical protein IWQ61_004315 [Dispira simplex]|nr:hypothetical protein IWQ61_004315 [Dispira simplex]
MKINILTITPLMLTVLLTTVSVSATNRNVESEVSPLSVQFAGTPDDNDGSTIAKELDAPDNFAALPITFDKSREGVLDENFTDYLRSQWGKSAIADLRSILSQNQPMNRVDFWGWAVSHYCKLDTPEIPDPTVEQWMALFAMADEGNTGKITEKQVLEAVKALAPTTNPSDSTQA